MRGARRLIVAVAVLACCGVLRAALPASDDFFRDDESPLGGNWTAPDGLADSKFLLSSLHIAGQAGATTQLMYWNFDSFTTGQFSRATLGGSALSDAATYAYVAINIQSSGQQAYVYGVIAGSSTYLLRKLTAAGTYTAITTCTGTPTAGDVLKLSNDGSGNLTGTVNGGSPCTGSDGSYTGGAAGAGGYGAAGAYTFDDWSGDNVGGVATPGCKNGLLLLGAGCEES